VNGVTLCGTCVCHAEEVDAIVKSAAAATLKETILQN